MTKRIGVSFGWSVMLAAGLAAPVSAHHSFSGYDMSKTLSAPATLKEFRWGAPHSGVVFMIKGAAGKPQEVSMASASPASFAKQGFKPRDNKVGDTEFGPGGRLAGGGNPADTQAEDAQFPPGTEGAK